MIIAVILCFVPCYLIYSIFDYLKAILELKSRVQGSIAVRDKSNSIEKQHKDDYLKRFEELRNIKTDLTKYTRDAKEAS